MIAFAEYSYDAAARYVPPIVVVNPNNPRASYTLLEAPAGGNVSDIVLQDERRAAWIGCRFKFPNRRDKNEPLCPGGVTKRIYVVDGTLVPKDARGPIVLNDAQELAAGRTIRSRSLTIDPARKTISWRQGDRTRRYRLR